MAGPIVILNGAPRSGKTTIARAMQEAQTEPWMNLGVDAHIATTPAHLRPGIGLRPGGERPDVEALLPALYGALYESVAAHSRAGLGVVVDVGHHEGHAAPVGVWRIAAASLSGLAAWVVGVRCPLEVIMRRRGEAGAPVPPGVRRWQEHVHLPGIYDLEVDTSQLTPVECAAAIGERLRTPPAALAGLARS